MGLFGMVVASMRHDVVGEMLGIGIASAVGFPSRLAVVGREGTV